MATKRVMRILAGDWPNKILTVDQQVAVVNEAADIMVANNGPNDPEAVMDNVNNFALWLGGQDNDVQVYAWQLIRRFHGIEVLATDKTHVRLEPLEEKIFAIGTPYRVETFETIYHYPWPRQFTDTFEERLERLADEVAENDDTEVTPVDLILGGRQAPELMDTDDAIRFIHDALEDLKALLAKYEGKTNVLYWERMNHYMLWLTEQDLEVSILGMRTALATYILPVDNRKLPAWSPLLAKIKPYMPA